MLFLLNEQCNMETHVASFPNCRFISIYSSNSRPLLEIEDCLSSSPLPHFISITSMTLTVLSQKSSLLILNIKKSFQIASAFRCLTIGMDLVHTHLNGEICCMFSLYKPSLPDYSSKKDESHFSSLSQEAWGLTNSFLMFLCFRSISFTPHF